MSLFKCKMCGGTIEVEPGATVGVCDSCGTKQTLPALGDDRRANLYDRANHFRRCDDFDKAAAIYEQILNEDGNDCEAYWSLVLCRYGIEYVEDPSTHRRVPTVNRAQFTSVLSDENYRQAIARADGYRREIYEQEAKAIDEIQKGILAISSREDPFDVFICYKEADANGRRTHDSVLANDLYHQLVQEGFKVFFARITLEDKLGQEYEPYIFAALNSAKVMVVLGTKPEYFNAVWVKNEWSRYLALIRGGAKKTLIPAFRDMDPYDLPDEFSHLQAQDMSKLGFMQDLIRGIKKICASDEPAKPQKEGYVQASSGANSTALMKRGFLALEDGEWGKADGFFEQVLNADAENAEAYLGKLMADMRVSSRERLRDCREPFDGNSNCKKAVRFGSRELKAELDGYVRHIKERNENERLTALYERAASSMKSASTEQDYRAAAEMFAEISGFRDADAKKRQCEGAAERIVAERKAKAEAERLEAERREEERRIAEEKAAEERKKRKKTFRIILAIICLCAAGYALMTMVVIPGQNYAEASAMKDAGRYEEAIAAFEALGEYKDSETQIEACKTAIKDREYGKAASLFESGKYEEAIAAFEALGGYKDSASQIEDCKEEEYGKALNLLKSGRYDEAYKLFATIKGYKDVDSLLATDDNLLAAARRAEWTTVGNIVTFGAYEQDNNTSNGKEAIEWIVLDAKDDSALIISRYGLDCKQYNEKNAGVTWETCTLRKWLNGEFLNAAFTDAEQARIVTTEVTADRNPNYGTDAGNATKDKVYLLSIDEANRYFASDEARKCAPTAYAKAQGAWTSDTNKTTDGKATGWWWLRSPGSNSSYAAYVLSDGSVLTSGRGVGISYGAARPALWVKF